MTDNEIMKLYYGWPDEQVKAIEKYVKKFHQPWPVMGPRDVELINHCVIVGNTIDQLPDDDEFRKKYYSEDVVY